MTRVCVIASFLLAAANVCLHAQETRLLPASDRPLDLETIELYRIGGTDAPDWATFEDVRRVAFDAIGRLHILDARARYVITVDTAGRLVRTTGREGAGPGEFRAPSDLVVRPDGSMLVYDALARSLTGFDAEGRYSRTWTLPRVIGTPAGLLETTPGVLIAPARLFTIDGVLSSRDGTPAEDQPIFRITLHDDGRAEVQRIAAAPITSPPPARSAFSPHVFAPRLLWTPFGDGFATLDSVTWEIELRDASGTPTGLVRRPLEPRAPGRADIAAARRESRARFIGPDGEPRVAGAGSSGTAPGRPLLQQIEDGLRNMTFADRVPLVLELMSDPHGRLWVGRTGDPWGQPGPTDVLDSTAGYLGTVQARRFSLPASFGPGGLAAWIETDALDATVIVVRRVVLRPD